MSNDITKKVKKLDIELLAPAGNTEKLRTALYFGADAVYLGGKSFGLRAFGENFDTDGLKSAADYAHSLGRKVYVTVNIFARDTDFGALKEYLHEVRASGADAVIVSDIGVMDFVRTNFPDIDLHISTQASTLNSYAAKLYERMGAKRIVLARELNLAAISDIRQALEDKTELEAFVHGAMCISYSGRCLLSNYMTGRDANRGECVQSCRWEYTLTEKSDPTRTLTLQQDERGSYILNSKDLNVIRYIDKVHKAGVKSFKIEGRVKSAYYAATVVNAYRRAIDLYAKEGEGFCLPDYLYGETEKTSHREFTTGFYFDNPEQCYYSSRPRADYDFVAMVTDCAQGRVTVEQRNRFVEGEVLEVLSPNDTFLSEVTVKGLKDGRGADITVADKVQGIVSFECGSALAAGDMLRRPAKVKPQQQQSD